MNEVVERMVDLLLRSGKKQKDLMNHLNVSQNLLTEWKAGRNKSYKKYIPQIAEYLGVSVDYLLGKTEQKELTAEDGELSDDVIIYHRDGQTKKKKLTKAQMDMLAAMIDALPDDGEGL